MIGKIDNDHVIESHKVKLLGIEIDRDLNFEDHVNKICTKAAQKLNALSRQCTILSFQKRRILVKAFFDSQFSYCPMVWMFHSRNLKLIPKLITYTIEHYKLFTGTIYLPLMNSLKGMDPSRYIIAIYIN